MITVYADQIVKKQENFWNHVLFHPTDAIEDEWGQRILCEIAKDGAAKTVRIYSMMEDIVSIGETGALQYDFTLTDVRLDFLLEKGFSPMIAYGCVPPILCADPGESSSVSFNKTRYKGKMWTTSQPKDYALWEEICYRYTKHIVERYGESTVAGWHLHCFNEPDIANFFMRDADVETRCREYCRLYEAFAKGVLRASEKLRIGGPALALSHPFMEGFLQFVQKKGLRLDYICFHNYGSDPPSINSGEKPLCVDNQFRNYDRMLHLVKRYYPQGIELVQDEWGMDTGGFLPMSRCAGHVARENEIFAAYYGRMIAGYVKEYENPGLQLLCLSGQHEMTAEFEGFRNFFSLHFIKKPIYNAFVLAAMLKEYVLADEITDGHVTALATRDGDGNLAILVNYADPFFDESLPDLRIPCRICGVSGPCKVTVRCIDKEHANPYRLSLREKMTEPFTEEQLARLREAAELRPDTFCLTADGVLETEISTTANGTVLLTVERL